MAINVSSLAGAPARKLSRTHVAGVYAPDPGTRDAGWLLFVQDGALVSRRLDTRALALVGETVPIAEQVSIGRIYGFFSASANGTLVYRSGTVEYGGRELVWFDRTVKRLETLGAAGAYIDVAISPSGKTIAVSQTTATAQGANRDIWLLDLRGMATRLTTDIGSDLLPVWSPDGSRLVYASSRRVPAKIYMQNANGAGDESVIADMGVSALPYSISPDGKLILFGVNDPNTKMDLWLGPLDGKSKPVPFLRTTFNEALASFSPVSSNGRKWVSYTSDESGTFEVYVTPYPATGEKHLISKGGGSRARWRADGKEIFYMALDRKIMAVDVRTSPRFESGVPRPLFQTRLNLEAGPFGPSGFQYDVSADGKRFLVNNDVPSGDRATPLTVVVNWQARK